MGPGSGSDHADTFSTSVIGKEGHHESESSLCKFYVEAVLHGYCYRIPHIRFVLWVCSKGCDWKQCPGNTWHQENLDLDSGLQKISHSLGITAHHRRQREKYPPMNWNHLNVHWPLQGHVCMRWSAHTRASVFIHFIWPWTQSCCLIFQCIFLLQDQACVHTNTCRGCLLLEVTKEARWPRLLQWQPSVRIPHRVFFKEQLLQSPDTPNFTTSIIAQARNSRCKMFLQHFSGKEILLNQFSYILSQ